MTTPSSPTTTSPTNARSAREASSTMSPAPGRGEDLLRQFLLRYDRETTQTTYRSALTRFFGTDLVTLDTARRVTSVDVNRYIEALEEHGLALSSIRGTLSVLRSFYGWLAAQGLVQRNPADRMLVRRIPRTDWRERPIHVLTLAEARALIDCTDAESRTGIRDRALLRVLIKGCLRRGEAVALDFEHVRRVGGYWTLTIPRAKGGADQHIKATDDVVASVAAVAELYGEETGPVFRTLLTGRPPGARLGGQAVYKIVMQAAERAGLPPITPHVLRHTGCTLALEAGATLQQMQAHARHKNIGTTMLYLHQRDRLANCAADFISVQYPLGHDDS